MKKIKIVPLILIVVVVGFGIYFMLQKIKKLIILLMQLKIKISNKFIKIAVIFLKAIMVK